MLLFFYLENMGKAAPTLIDTRGRREQLAFKDALEEQSTCPGMLDWKTSGLTKDSDDNWDRVW